MMAIIDIGTRIDINKLLETRLIAQANSGGGKSYLIRKLLEECFGKVQIIVLDYEDEFSSLRELYDFVLFGDEGDYPVNVRYADRMAHTLLELNVSAIISLYELEQSNRILFVKRFLTSMLNAKKQLWHPCIVVIDEAHIFAPEKTKSDARDAVNGLLTRGRKRGFCAVLATQRLSKLAKDSAAECNNKFIGRCSMDIDMKRAGEELGFTNKSDMLKLRTMKPGTFFAFGPALLKASFNPTLITIKPVKTTHEVSVDYAKHKKTPPPSNKIKKLLKLITDIPKEAEKELKTNVDLKKEVFDLKRQLTTAKRVGMIQPVDVEKEKAYKMVVIHNRAIKKAVDDFTKVFINNIPRIELEFKAVLKRSTDIISLITNANQTVNVASLNTQDIRDSIKILEKQNPIKTGQVQIIHPAQKQITLHHTAPKVKPYDTTKVNDIDIVLGRCEKAIADFLFARFGKRYSRVQVAVFTGYSIKSGGFANAIARLNSLNYIIKEGRDLTANGDMLDSYSVDDTQITDFTKEMWIGKLGKCAGAVYKFLLDSEGSAFSRADVAIHTGYSVLSGGFANAIAKLNSLGLIKKEGVSITLNPELREV